MASAIFSPETAEARQLVCSLVSRERNADRVGTSTRCQEQTRTGSQVRMQFGVIPAKRRVVLCSTCRKPNGAKLPFYGAEDIAIETEEIFVRLGGHSDALQPSLQFAA